MGCQATEGGKSVIAAWRSVVYLGFRMHAEIKVRRSGDVGCLLAQERSMNEEKYQNTLKVGRFSRGGEAQFK
jgi:UDP-glucose 4-epimerase